MKKTRISNAENAEIFRGLEYFIHAGISGADALAMMAEDTADESRKRLFAAMAESAGEGANLSQTFRQTEVFDKYACDMLAVGEETGRLEDAVRAVADNSDRRADLDRRLSAALLYPSILLLIMLAVIGVLLIYVLPIFNEVYAQLGTGLSGIALWLMKAGRVMGTITPALCTVLAIGVIYLTLFASIPRFRSQLVSDWEKSRGNKGAFGKINTARFAQTLYMCINSGLTAEKALELAAEMLPGSGESCARCHEMMEQGCGFAEALKETGLLSASDARLLETGFRSGSVEAALGQISARLTASADEALEEAVGRVEPAMVIVTSLLVGLILVAVMMPLINIMSAIG